MRVPSGRRALATTPMSEPPQIATEALERWASDCVAVAPGSEYRFSAVSGDASFRRYYRLSVAGKSFIAVSAPPDKEDNEAFVRVRRLLADGGVRVPELLAFDAAQGFLLLSDFGDRLLLAELDTNTVDDWYARAGAVLAQLQGVDGSALPRYDRAALDTEIRLFDRWFLDGLLAYQPSAAAVAALDDVRNLLLDSALQQPRVLVHRDFHSRNLMVLPERALGVIDFQDARHGPITYDLVSLLRDCYVSWAPERVAAWALGHRDRLQGLGLLGEVTDAEFLRWFDLMGLQRHLKVLGIFARLHLRDGKPGYLDDLPLVVHYTLSVARNYRETQGLVSLFEQELMPRIREQPWWREL